MVEGKFYYTTKKRVEAYFKDNKARNRQTLTAAASGRPHAGPADFFALLHFRSLTRGFTLRCSSRLGQS